MYTRQGREVMLQEVVGTHHEVTLLIAVNMDVRHLQVTVDSRRKLFIHFEHLKGVADGYGVEDGLEVVVTVWASLNDVKPQVDFCDRFCYH